MAIMSEGEIARRARECESEGGRASEIEKIILKKI